MELFLFQLVWIVPLCCWVGWIFCEIKLKNWLGIILGIATAASTGFLFLSGKEHYAMYDRLYQMEILRDALVSIEAGKTDEVTILLQQCVAPNIWTGKTEFYQRRTNLQKELKKLTESVQSSPEAWSSEAAAGPLGNAQE